MNGEMAHHGFMPKRVKQKRTSYENEIAFQLVQRLTEEPEPSRAVPAPIIPVHGADRLQGRQDRR